MSSASPAASTNMPRVTAIRVIRVIRVAGRASMLLNLGGAHRPCFTGKNVILTGCTGAIGPGEAPGGEPIRKTLDEAPRAPRRLRQGSILSRARRTITSGRASTAGINLAGGPRLAGLNLKY
jgi:hypothetical protein